MNRLIITDDYGVCLYGHALFRVLDTDAYRLTLSCLKGHRGWK